MTFQFQHQTSLQMQGGRGGSFFPVSASLRSAARDADTRDTRDTRDKTNRKSLYSIPPPDFKFKPGVSGEKLL